MKGIVRSVTPFILAPLEMEFRCSAVRNSAELALTLFAN